MTDAFTSMISNLANAPLATSTLDARTLARIDESAKDFEAMFLSDMMSHMFDTVGTDKLFGGGHAEETWRGMMVEQYSRQVVGAGGFGLSDSIKQQMIAMQEAANQ